VDAGSTDPTALSDESVEVAAPSPVAQTFGPDDQPAAQAGMDSAVFDGEIVLFDPEHRMLRVKRTPSSRATHSRRFAG